VTTKHSSQRIGWISGFYSLYDQSMPAKNSDGVLRQKIKILFLLRRVSLKRNGIRGWLDWFFLFLCQQRISL
jgi:hypothetical protein